MITVDVRMLHASGIGTYLQHLLPLLVTSGDNAPYDLLGDMPAMRRHVWTQRDNVRLTDCRAPIYSVAEQIELPRRTSLDTRLFWAPHYNIPLMHRGRLLVTIHDVLHLARPQYVSGLHRRFYARAMFRAVKSKAVSIICVSHFTADELVRLTGVHRDSIAVIHEGVDASWFEIEPDERPHARPFFLAVGNVKPHKNLSGLVDAFALLRDELPHDLVIVGKREGFITGDIRVAQRAAALGDRIRFTGYLDDRTLRQYFAHADALLFPSFYEGFGLPPLEAMACGCPVIVSRTASLPEVCGDAALYCDPGNPADIAEKIRLLMSSAALQMEMKERGIERARLFTWEACADETWTVISRVLERG